MLNGRLYRAAFAPFVVALAVAAFSLSAPPRPLTSTLAPDAFNGSLAFAELNGLAVEFPDRRPGSRGDEALGAHIVRTLEGLGGAAHGGFSVRTRRFSASTIDGERNLTTVIAQRPGSTNSSAIVIFAHRDSAAPGPARAELSATVALIELARVFAARETKRTIVLVSTSAGSGGAAGAADFLGHAHGLDAAIVLGDLAGPLQRVPSVVPYSNGFGSAPLQLQRTLTDAITQETGSAPRTPSTIGQLAHLAFALTAGEQGPLDAGGLPATLVSLSGERSPAATAPVGKERLEAFGRATLSAIDALDNAPDISSRMQTGVLVSHKTFPSWALRLLVATLLFPPLLLAADGLARLRRRSPRGSRLLARSLGWVLTCAIPFFACAVFARLLGFSGILGGAVSAAARPGELPFGAAAASAVVAAGLVLALAWVLWPMLVRRLRLDVRPHADGAGLAMLFVLLGVCALVWALDPFTALLMLPALHLWLLIVSPELRPGRLGTLALLALALLPLALLVAFYADQ
ncbi:MAG: M28 family peptidase, partial [Actinomycetota bacterium]|nr:M28 family peptidase [Actinomycetota bacterium]